jgi:4-hydroxy-tetrahydrodipicolinate synthase
VIGGGGARYFIDEYNRGACGAMPAVELADVHVAMDRAFRAGDIDRARELYMRTLPLLVIQANFRMAFTKHVLSRRGVLDNRVVRAKVPPWTPMTSPRSTPGSMRAADLMRNAVPPSMLCRRSAG